jgi:endonuclease/exonuclease/phosphatase family metal-dependent hydrolase
MTTFRLMTYNILDGGVGREAAVIEVIQAAAPDVVVVQEVMQPAVLEQMAAALGMTHCLAQGPTWGRKVGLLSRLPILACRSHHLWGAGRHCLEVSIRVLDARSLTLYGLHLMPYHSWFFEWLRGQEIRYLLQHIRGVAPGPHLLAGDFNAIAPGDRARLDIAPLWVKAQLWFQLGRVLRRALKPLLDAGYVDCFRALHPGEDGFTLPSLDPTVRLDYIFADPTLGPYLHRCRVVTEPEAVNVVSDHLPVLAEFEWRDYW